PQHVPLVSIAVAFVLGFLFLLPFPSWQALIGIITSATVLSYGLQPLALTALRRQAPDADRPYRLPVAEIVAPIAFIVANLIIYALALYFRLPAEDTRRYMTELSAEAEAEEALLTSAETA